MADFETVGKSLPRIDGPDKATGAGLYTGDILLPRMLHGKILRSPLPHALILDIDIRKALRVPGVKAVITADDTPKKKYGMVKPDEHMLALDKVRYIGDEVAAVAAESEEAAEEAVQQIVVEYQELPAVFDAELALKPPAPEIHPGGNLASQFKYERGNVEQGFKQSDLILNGRYQTAMSHQSYMEPRGCLASADPSGKVTIWGGFSGVFRIRRLVASVLDLDENRLRVIQPLCGGSFGGKGSSSKAAVCALLSIKTGRPVRILNSRAEEFQAGRPRVGAVIETSLGVRRDGTLVARKVKVVADCGAYAGIVPAIAEMMPLRPESFYRFDHLAGEGVTVYTNKTPTGPCRGFGNPQNSFALETLLDEAAEALSMDPLKLRLKNILHTGDTSLHGWKMTSCGLEECLHKAAQAFNWERKRSTKKPGRGIGLACSIHNSGIRKQLDFDGSSALLKMDADGRVTLITGEGDTGQGGLSILGQIAAEELGVPLNWVSVPGPDTDISPYGLGAYAGRVTTIGGNAARAAARDAKAQLLQVAATLLEANPHDLECKGGKVYVKGSPHRGLDIAQVSRAAIFRQGGGPILGRGTYDPPTEMQDKHTLYGHYSPNYPFCAEMVEVEVDRQTGQVKVVAVTAADDIGKAINPMGVEGQIQGCVSQGLGFSTTEEMVWDNGRLVNPSFADYKLPTALDMPRVDSIIVESNDPVGPFGAKAASETTVIPMAAAIANAIYDALGVRLRSLPITPEKLLQALREKEKRQKPVLGKTL
ncbi:MAG: xanthine dehydrogenase family protein molybdopterin-binding subunit [Thermodesulfobacteriota bacterium]